jgi:hypothetical protein
MTRTVGANLKTHLAASVTTIAYLWKIVRTDGTEYYFTDHDEDIIYSGDTYSPADAASYSAMKQTDELNPDNFDFEMILDSNNIDIEDLKAGRFDYADVYIYLINYESIPDGVIQLIRGKLGQIEILGDNKAKAEFRGLTQLLSQSIGRIYGLECDADLGDDECKIDLDASAELVTDGSFAGDGSAWTQGTGWALDDPNNEMDCDGSQVANSDLSQDISATAGKLYRVTFTISNYSAGDLTPLVGTGSGAAVAANGLKVQYITAAGSPGSTLYFRADADFVGTIDDISVKRLSDFHAGGSITNVSNNKKFDDSVRSEATGFFDYGVITFRSGLNIGLSKEVKRYTNGGSPAVKRFRLVAPMPFTVAVGDAYEVYQGCDKQMTTCRDTFSNMVNYRGFPYIPGIDQMLDYPDGH